jgi:hypothetical protein
MKPAPCDSKGAKGPVKGGSILCPKPARTVSAFFTSILPKATLRPALSDQAFCTFNPLTSVASFCTADAPAVASFFTFASCIAVASFRTLTSARPGGFVLHSRFFKLLLEFVFLHHPQFLHAPPHLAEDEPTWGKLLRGGTMPLYPYRGSCAFMRSGAIRPAISAQN